MLICVGLSTVKPMGFLMNISNLLPDSPPRRDGSFTQHGVPLGCTLRCGLAHLNIRWHGLGFPVLNHYWGDFGLVFIFTSSLSQNPSFIHPLSILYPSFIHPLSILSSVLHLQLRIVFVARSLPFDASQVPSFNLGIVFGFRWRHRPGMTHISMKHSPNYEVSIVFPWKWSSMPIHGGFHSPMVRLQRADQPLGNTNRGEFSIVVSSFIVIFVVFWEILLKIVFLSSSLTVYNSCTIVIMWDRKMRKICLFCFCCFPTWLKTLSVWRSRYFCMIYIYIYILYYNDCVCIYIYIYMTTDLSTWDFPLVAITWYLTTNHIMLSVNSIDSQRSTHQKHDLL